MYTSEISLMDSAITAHERRLHQRDWAVRRRELEAARAADLAPSAEPEPEPLHHGLRALFDRWFGGHGHGHGARIAH